MPLDKFRPISEERLPKVAVLLCTYNPNQYLVNQLQSIDTQNYPNISIWISRDSEDQKTAHILEEYNARYSKAKIEKIVRGPGTGFASNFLSLIERKEIEADYFAYCDQDDIWHEDKIERAVKKLGSTPKEIPALYCSRTNLVDKNGNHIGYSPLFKRPPSFKNALVQNIAGGNTMVLNRAARDLLQKIGRVDVVCHDWWTYLLVTAAGGVVFYDAKPGISYRQHGGNLIGANSNWRSSLFRFLNIFSSNFKEWQELNLAALNKAKPFIADESKQSLNLFQRARNSGLLMRLLWLKRSGIYRQSIKGTITLYFGIVLGRI